MKIQELRALPSNYGGLRGVTRYIVIHYTGNAKDTARANANYFANNRVGASAHYFVDDNEIYSSVPEGYIAWHCETRGMSFKCACRNNNSIGIELCTCGNYQISDKTAKRAAELVKSLMDKYDVPIDRVIRHYDVCGKRCMPTDVTELLTPNGWVYLNDINIGDSVVTFNTTTNRLEYGEVKNKVEPYYSKTIKNHSLELTEDHRVWAKANCISGVWREKIWGDILEGNKLNLIPTNGIFEHYTGLDITDNELRLLVWVQGDGHYMRDSKGNIRGLDFHFSKKRKVNRLCRLIYDLNGQYTFTIQENGTYRIKVYNEHFNELCERYLDNKRFTYEFINMNMSQYKIFFDELVLVDGNPDKMSYCSAIEHNLDVVQAIHTTHGTRSNKCQTGISRCVITAKGNFSVGKRIGGNNSLKTRETEVSCVTVENGFILIRQNGKPFIVGNCPAPWVDDINKWLAFKEMLQDMTETKVKDMISRNNDELIKMIDSKIDKAKEVKYDKLEDIPAWASDVIKELVEDGTLKGDGSNLDLSKDMLRLLVILKRRSLI